LSKIIKYPDAGEEQTFPTDPQLLMVERDTQELPDFPYPELHETSHAPELLT
jgi:hypothetical protein